MRKQPSLKTQSGNIMIYILGAIVLLGVLVILVKGSTTPGSGIDNESLQLKVAEVQQYGMELERAVAYILRSGYSETDIRFAHPNHSSAYGDITDDPFRQVFAREGGGATLRDNDTSIQTQDEDWVFNANNRLVESGTTCTLESCTELIAFLPYVTESFCFFINEKNNTLLSGASPQDNGSVDITNTFSGSFVYLNSIPDDFNGSKEGCFEGDVAPPSGTYHYYRVLLAR